MPSNLSQNMKVILERERERKERAYHWSFRGSVRSFEYRSKLSLANFPPKLQRSLVNVHHLIGVALVDGGDRGGGYERRYGGEVGRYIRGPTIVGGW